MYLSSNQSALCTIRSEQLTRISLYVIEAIFTPFSQRFTVVVNNDLADHPGQNLTSWSEPATSISTVFFFCFVLLKQTLLQQCLAYK